MVKFFSNPADQPHYCQIYPDAFGRLRGFRFHLSVHDTQLRHYPPEALNRMIGGVTFLRLSLRNNKLSTFNPFLTPNEEALNESGTILESVDLRVPILLEFCSIILNLELVVKFFYFPIYLYV